MFEQIISLISPELIREILVATHAFGVIIAIGGSLFAHFYVFKNFELAHKIITKKDYRLINLIHPFILFGFYITIATGFGLIVYYAFFMPEALWNTKIYAKLLIVSVIAYLTTKVPHINSKLLKDRVGKHLFDDLQAKEISSFLFIGTMSLLSWAITFILGSMRSLNYIAKSYHDLFITCSLYVLPYAILIAFLYGICSLVGEILAYLNNNHKKDNHKKVKEDQAS